MKDAFRAVLRRRKESLLLAGIVALLSLVLCILLLLALRISKIGESLYQDVDFSLRLEGETTLPGVYTEQREIYNDITKIQQWFEAHASADTTLDGHYALNAQATNLGSVKDRIFRPLFLFGATLQPNLELVEGRWFLEEELEKESLVAVVPAAMPMKEGDISRPVRIGDILQLHLPTSEELLGNGFGGVVEKESGQSQQHNVQVVGTYELAESFEMVDVDQYAAARRIYLPNALLARWMNEVFEEQSDYISTHSRDQDLLRMMSGIQYQMKYLFPTLQTNSLEKLEKLQGEMTQLANQLAKKDAQTGEVTREYSVTSTADQAKKMAETIRTFQIVLLVVFGGLTMLMIALFIHFLLLFLKNRKRELRIRRALGSDPVELHHFLFLEKALVALPAFCVGYFAGYLGANRITETMLETAISLKRKTAAISALTSGEWEATVAKMQTLYRVPFSGLLLLLTLLGMLALLWILTAKFARPTNTR